MKLLNIIRSKVDDTIKYQFCTSDNYIIESCVIFFYDEEASVNICVSSQVGCMCNCLFCTTGRKRFIRNLLTEEIIEQFDLIYLNTPKIQGKCFEITYMGTGEPLNNMEGVLGSINHFDKSYKNLKRINISTIMPLLNLQLGDINKMNHSIHFQYSMHFLTDELREKYFGTKLISITDSLSYLNHIAANTKEDFCINYILFKALNDSTEDAQKLAKLVSDLNAYVKVSKYCPIFNSTLEPSENFDQFVSVLEKANVRWKSFESKGSDIKAACGHLLSDIDF